MSSSEDIDEIIAQYEAQECLFSAQVSRLQLLQADVKSAVHKTYSINVWQNHNFELLIPLLGPYIAFGGWQADFHVSHYDDSLMFTELQAADVDILWLDSERFLGRVTFIDWLQWLESRLKVLRELAKGPIILATWGTGGQETERLQLLVDSLPAVYFADLKSASLEANVPLLDIRSAVMAGTSVSSAAQLALARKLACHWLPGALLPPVKAIALDLDHTLHRGVLGEEGVQGVQLTEEHKKLQHYIKSLQQKGIFIALVSKNELGDVKDLFLERQDYPLRWEDFSAVEVSWGDKASAVKRIAQALRIALDAVLFVDDNPGELANLAMQLPPVRTVFAHPDAGITRQVVYFYPGLWRWKIENDDAKRIQDLKANAEREVLAESIADPAEYFRSLQVALLFRNDPQEQLSRLADLCNKTNQFNLSLRRFNQVELFERLYRIDACVTSVQLVDRLSDSGVIAVIIAERKGEQLLVLELCISCRAMGRQLEDMIILLALRDMPIFTGCRDVVFHVQHGPRNKPALNWLARLFDINEVPPPGRYTLSAQRLLNFAPVQGVSLIKE